MFCGNRRKFKDESGQVLVFAIIAMVVLIGLTGFALDVGHAYLVQRQLQASTDAAALAGALDLPDTPRRSSPPKTTARSRASATRRGPTTTPPSSPAIPRPSA